MPRTARFSPIRHILDAFCGEIESLQNSHNDNESSDFSDSESSAFTQSTMINSKKIQPQDLCNLLYFQLIGPLTIQGLCHEMPSNRKNVSLGCDLLVLGALSLEAANSVRNDATSFLKKTVSFVEFVVENRGHWIESDFKKAIYRLISTTLPLPHKKKVSKKKRLRNIFTMLSEGILAK
ncbi:hypothetical protein GcM3_207033 [Golovinomyces cichoracearum]|uniref:Uncharacterized protein n=1 Tax=Golovinomyces cichoracearum TaxID=62708 RepID=A0A420HB37_9PEZI|nr:hypothetical protein GcM3_207033 [Golovinomyces cichoracearum]